MRDSFLERRDHTQSRRQVLNDCATRAPGHVGFLIFQPAFWGRGLAPQYSGNPVWVESPCPLLGETGLRTLRAGISRLLFSGGFPWRSAVPLLRVRAAVAESQSLSQNRGIMDRSPLMFWQL